ncbi:TetR/AcrR family transcriptional regulator [Actinotalea solisilvae]|uniref:TetR/AcrR family transcriptional regulator n=1 Tax=Actinotalea solisilvae TaxID=2072922 RepID=UPI0018F1EE32|nr:TetR family transcriptional regulator [Actinotalea solisilvae]
MTSRAEATRERLRRSALALFVERGFDAVTVVDVAAAAGVSHMTFFRHFATKEDVLLDDPYDEVIVDAVLAQDARLPALEQVRLGFLAAWGALPEPAADETRARVRLVAGHPALRARAWENNRRTGDLVVAALVDRGVPPVDARVAAGACLGALLEALLAWGAADPDEPLGPLVRHALGLLGGDRRSGGDGAGRGD